MVATVDNPLHVYQHEIDRVVAYGIPGVDLEVFRRMQADGSLVVIDEQKIMGGQNGKHISKN